MFYTTFGLCYKVKSIYWLCVVSRHLALSLIIVVLRIESKLTWLQVFVGFILVAHLGRDTNRVIIPDCNKEAQS